MRFKRAQGLVAAAILAMVVGVAAAQAPRLASEATKPTVTQTAPPNAAAKQQSFLNLLMRGGWAMIPLGACSLLALALIIERGLALRRNQIIPAGFMTGLQNIFRSPRDLDAGLEYCRTRPAAISRIMAVGMRKMAEGPAVAEQAISDQGATEVARMRRNLRLMHGIAAITPTLGLLGTVWGMIRAFEAASQTGLGGHSEMLTQGIYESLVATMTGLMIAVPVLVAYYAYLGIIDRAVLELNDAATAFMERTERTAVTMKPPGVPGEPADVNSTATSNVM